MNYICSNLYYYLVPGATVSENESLSLPSTEEDSILPSSALKSTSQCQTYQQLIPNNIDQLNVSIPTQSEQQSDSKRGMFDRAINHNLKPICFMPDGHSDQIPTECEVKNEDRLSQNLPHPIIEESVIRDNEMFADMQNISRNEHDIEMNTYF